MSDSTSEARDKPGGKTGLQGRRLLVSWSYRETHVNSKCNQEETTSTIFKEQEEEKKRKYQQRALGSFGGMGGDCKCFLKRLSGREALREE